jgi:hypothetical protein
MAEEIWLPCPDFEKNVKVLLKRLMKKYLNTQKNEVI